MNMFGPPSSELRLARAPRLPGADTAPVGRRFTVAKVHLSASRFMVSELKCRSPKLLKLVSMVPYGPDAVLVGAKKGGPLDGDPSATMILSLEAGRVTAHSYGNPGGDPLFQAPPRSALSEQIRTVAKNLEKVVGVLAREAEGTSRAVHDGLARGKPTVRPLPTLFGLHDGAVVERPDIKGVVRLLPHTKDSMVAVQRTGEGEYGVVELTKTPAGDVSARAIDVPFTNMHPSCRVAVDSADYVYAVSRDGKTLAKHGRSPLSDKLFVESIKVPQNTDEILDLASTGISLYALVRLKGGETGLFRLSYSSEPKEMAPPEGLDMSTARLVVHQWGPHHKKVGVSGLTDGKHSWFHADTTGRWRPL